MTGSVPDDPVEGALPEDIHASSGPVPGPGAETGFPIVGIGASAGGLDAFTQLLVALPVDTGMAFVLVQHLAPSHPSALAEILSRATKMPVAEVHDASVVQPDHVYVIPPGQSMIIEHGTLKLLRREGRGLHRPIDQFFHALAQDQRHRAIGVVLSGTATDGTLGLEAIKAGGGISFAQDGTAQHDGMPQSAIDSGCVDFVLPPDEIAREIVRIASHPYVAPLAGAQTADDKPDLAQVVELIHRATGVDFTHYKFNTLHRRIRRRMVFARMNSIREYVAYLRKTPAEVGALFQDILISVTSFFRDPEAFEALRTTVFPRLLEKQTRNEPLRLWTIGCSTGQEAYSLAMALTEAIEAARSSATFLLFATDINGAALDKARAGVYSKDIVADISPERLQRFFNEEHGCYQISKTIREACVFSRHNVLEDPPFSRIDLISCRNLLIYMEPVLQQRIMPLLHYALRPGGWLWLGSSETIGNFRDLFEPAEDKQRLFTRRPGSEGAPGRFPLQHGGMARSAYRPATHRVGNASELPREADRVLLNRYAPPGVIVSDDLEILQFRGDTSMYLAPAAGTASLSLLKMLRPELLVAVRAAIHRAREAREPVREQGLRVKRNGDHLDAVVEVIPLRDPGAVVNGGFLVLFESAQSVSGTAPAPATSQTPSGELTTARLEHELAATREYLQTIIEQQEAANEELQSANEEVQSANEELQSTNEELETSKEEIQSSNEELSTVNEELNNRNAELHRINDDLQNLFANAQMVVVMLDMDLRVRRFTPMAENLIGLRTSDHGRQLANLTLNFIDISDLEGLLAKVRDSEHAEDLEVRDRRGHWYALRLRPYRTVENRVDGVIVMLIDIDLIKRAHAQTESIVATVHEPLLVLDDKLCVRSASRAFYESFGVSPETTVGKRFYEINDHLWDIAELRRLIDDVLERDDQFRDFAVVSDSPEIGTRTMLLNARRLVQVDDHTPSILVAIEDVTERKRTEAALKVSELRFRRLFEASKEGILILDAVSHKITHVNPFLSTLLGHHSNFILGKELWEIGLLRDRQTCQAAMQQVTEQGSIRYDSLPIEDRSGELHAVDLIANMYKEDHHRVIQCSIRDISDRNRLEMLLLRQAAELADLHRRKDEFLAMLSHELRSPLAPIASAVQLLALEHGTESQVQKQARGIIERQMGQLQQLVDDLLEVSRITTGRLQLRRELVTASDIIKNAVETVRPLLTQCGHSFTLSLADDPITLYADSARLEQVLTNLLTNAIKFTDRGGKIRLSEERDGDQCVLRVKDTGIGISPSRLPSIFELFTQGEQSIDRSQGGLGIGLALVERLTKLHGGTVEAHSVEGQGSEFIVRLPLVKTKVPLPPSVAPVLQPALRSLRVLLVDDSADTVLSFSMLLKALGHDVRTASDGATAIQTALEYLPDVVLLDIGLPELNGYEVAARIRLEASLRGVVLVALTGYGQETDRGKALQAGFDHHLVKPADVKKLEQILHTASTKVG